MPKPRISRAELHLYGLAVAIALGALAYTLVSGKQHDYITHVKMWSQIAAGTPPWEAKGNMYGPGFHMFIGVWASLHELAPKFLYFCAWQALEVGLLLRARRNIALSFAIVCLMNSPLFWVEVYRWGHMEALVGPLLVAGIALNDRKKDSLAGVFLALAVSIKYFPAVVIPFLAIRSGKLNRRLCTSFGLTLLGIFTYCIARWRLSFLKRIFDVAGAPSEHMSPFRYMRGNLSPLHWIGVDNLDFLSLPLLLGALVYIFLRYYNRKVAQLPAMAAALLATVVCYRVGYAQYFVPYFAVQFYYLATQEDRSLDQTLETGILPFLPLFFVTFFQCIHAFDIRMFYDSSGTPEWPDHTYFGHLYLNEWAGLVALVAFLPALRWWLTKASRVDRTIGRTAGFP